MGEHAASQIEPPSDTHGSSGFRRQLAATLVSRALAEASQR
jgi:CO/xanthine dehydrogenase FAD-binding subunit